MLNILILIRSDAKANNGGDHLQACDYAKALIARGHSVELTYGPRENIDGFDIIHLFNTYRISECLQQLKFAKAKGIKVVLSPIYHSNQLIRNLYWRLYRIPRFFYGLTLPLREVQYCRRYSIDYNLNEVLNYVSSQRTLFMQSDFIIPNSIAESGFIETELEIRLRSFSVIQNSVSEVFQNKKRVASSNSKLGLLCVGRIEPLKNQLKVLEAFRAKSGLEMKIEFVGKKGTNRGYFNKFMDLVNQTPNAFYLGELTREQLATKYLNSRGLIHASHFETTGLIGMEALCCGGKLAISDTPYTREYYEGYAYFVEPDDVSSISHAIDWLYDSSDSVPVFKPIEWVEIGRSLEKIYMGLIRDAKV